MFPYEAGSSLEEMHLFSVIFVSHVGSPEPLSETAATKELHCLESVQIRSYFWSAFSCIQSEYRNIRTRNNSVFGNFSHSANAKEIPILSSSSLFISCILFIHHHRQHFDATYTRLALYAQSSYSR